MTVKIKNKGKAISAKELEERFDRGEDIIKYMDLSKTRRVNEGGLPSIIEIIIEDQTEKITIPLTSYSVAYFKSVAKKHKSSYQRIIRRLLHQYAKLERQKEAEAKNLEKRSAAPGKAKAARKRKKTTAIARKKAKRVLARVG